MREHPNHVRSYSSPLPLQYSPRKHALGSSGPSAWQWQPRRDCAVVHAAMPRAVSLSWHSSPLLGGISISSRIQILQASGRTSEEPRVALFTTALAQTSCISRDEVVVALDFQDLQVCLDDGVCGGLGDRLAQCAQGENEVCVETNQRADQPECQFSIVASKEWSRKNRRTLPRRSLVSDQGDRRIDQKERLCVQG